MNRQSATYVFGGNQNELNRLLGQAEDLKPESTWLLDQIGIRAGWRAADIGCGPIGVLDLLSERVGPTGAVLGVEREARFAAMARSEIAKRGLQNVSIVEGDTLSTALEKGSFDLVHERLVLINVPVANQQCDRGVDGGIGPSRWHSRRRKLGSRLSCVPSRTPVMANSK